MTATGRRGGPGPWSLVLLLALAAPAPAFRGDGGEHFRRGVAFLDGDPAGRVLDPSEQALPEEARLERAVEHLDRARNQVLGDAEAARVDRRLGAATERLGRLVAARDPGAAARWFGRARALDPGDPYLGLDLASALVEAGELAEAERVLAALEPTLPRSLRARGVLLRARALTRRADAGEGGLLARAEEVLAGGSAAVSPEARDEVQVELGRTRFRLRDLAGAVAAFRDVSGILPLNAVRELRLAETLLERLRRGEGVEAGVDRRVRIRAATPLAGSSIEIFRALFARARDEVGRVLDVFPEGILEVELLEEKDYTRVLASHTDGFAGSAGVVLRLRPGRAPEAWAATIFHEYAHHAIRVKTRGNLPPRWFDEGLAMVLEPGALPLTWYKRALDARRAGRLPGLDALRAFRGADLPTLYATAALLVEHLVARFGWGALARVLDRVAAGEPLGTALREDTGYRLDELLRRFEAELLDMVRARVRAARGGDAGGGEAIFLIDLPGRGEVDLLAVGGAGPVEALLEDSR